MSATTAGRVLTALYPPPLLVQRKPRRTTFRRRILLHKSTDSQSSDQYVCGPLDDIIDEIKSEIWESPPNYDLDPTISDWAGSLYARPTWTATPLPVSRIPSDQPLTIRKNRNSRSTASGSSWGDPMADSRNNSQDSHAGNAAVGFYPASTSPWPLLETVPHPDHALAHIDPSKFTTGAERHTAQLALESVVHNAESRSGETKRRPSRLRLFTNGFPRLRRTGTGETSTSTTDAPESPSPTVVTSLAAHDEAGFDPKDPSDEAVAAYMRKHARNATKFESVMKLITGNTSSPMGDHDDSNEHISTKKPLIPTTLRPAVRIFTETKILAQDVQDIRLAVDIEGVLHNRKPLLDTTIDVVLVVDNGYYVTKECLHEALEAVNGAIYYLGRGDRVALYTTHCTHHTVTGNRPDLLYPLRPFSVDNEEIFRDLTAGVAVCGMQVWEPPRPNPPMTEVILGIVRSFEEYNPKTGRTHVILLSPAACVLHDVSTHFPDIYIHRINPAVLPYQRNPEFQDTVCTETCCKNVFISNSASYQSVHSRIKRVIKNARAERPVGELTSMSIDIRTRNGCELIEYNGAKDIPILRLGQVHTLHVRIRVTRADTQSVDLNTSNPVFKSSLEVKDLRQELRNALTVGAVKVHLLDFQALHRNSIHSADSWNYAETPLLIIREFGSLAPPIDTAMEVYKRLNFYNFVNLAAEEAKTEAEKLLSTISDDQDRFKKLVARVAKEAERHQAIQQYEHDHRQRLPLCPGPVEIESSGHDWLVEMWDRKKCKRKGVAVVKDQVINGLVVGMKGLERLG